MNVQKMAATKANAKPKEKVSSTPYEKAFCAYIALTGLIVFFIPDDILKTHPWAVTFTDFMAGCVPQIDVITGLRIRPDLARFYYSVLWALSPILFLICCLMGWEGHNRTYPFWTMPAHKAALLALFICILLYASTKGFWMTATSNGVLRFIVGNRLGMAYAGNLTYVVGPAMFAAGLFNVTIGWLTGAIPREIRRQKAGDR